MGYQTTIGILNDQWDKIKNHPEEFVDTMDKRINGIEVYQNGVEVTRPHHADDFQLLFSGENCLIPINSDGLRCLSAQHRKEVIKKAELILHWAKSFIGSIEHKPYNKDIIQTLVRKHGKIITVEDFRTKCDNNELNYDDYGHPVKNNKRSSQKIHTYNLSDIPSDATHIVWIYTDR